MLLLFSPKSLVYLFSSFSSVRFVFVLSGMAPKDHHGNPYSFSCTFSLSLSTDSITIHSSVNPPYLTPHHHYHTILHLYEMTCLDVFVFVSANCLAQRLRIEMALQHQTAYISGLRRSVTLYSPLLLFNSLLSSRWWLHPSSHVLGCGRFWPTFRAPAIIRCHQTHGMMMSHWYEHTWCHYNTTQKIHTQKNLPSDRFS